MKVLCLDPSGNYNEGEGTTGWALFEDGELKDFGRVESKHYSSQENYWFQVGWLLELYRPSIVVCESYKLFGHKANQQIGSAMETPQLIGHLRMTAWLMPGTEFIFQHPQDKIRVADPQLVTLGVIEKRGNKHYCLNRPTVIHERDAIRHGIFYYRYGKGKRKG